MKARTERSREDVKETQKRGNWDVENEKKVFEIPSSRAFANGESGFIYTQTNFASHRTNEKPTV